MDELIDILISGGHSLVVWNEGVHTFDGRGVSDLFRLLENDPALLKGARIADKVIGKGAAALMVSGGVSEVYAGVISEGALSLFEKAGIGISFGKRVPHIINRKGDGICPVESLCADCETAEECLPRIRSFILSMRASAGNPA